MSLGAVPDDDEMFIDGMRAPGRRLRAASRKPVAWVTDMAFPCAGLTWTGRMPQDRSLVPRHRSGVTSSVSPSIALDPVHRPVCAKSLESNITG